MEEYKKLFSAIRDEVLDNALENAKQIVDIKEDKAHEFMTEKLSQKQNVDILQQGRQEAPVKKEPKLIQCPNQNTTGRQSLLAD